MRINTNVQSLQAQESATNTANNMRSSLEKLGSGLAINKASDDGAGLSIADKLRTQASSIGQAVKNGNSAIAMTQMADKAMDEQSKILDTVKTKLVAASTATTTGDGRHAIAKDVSKLLAQLDNIASTTNYNGTYLLQNDATSGSGAARAAMTFQMGENAADNITTVATVRANTTGLNSVSGVGLASIKTTVDSEAAKTITTSFGISFSQTVADGFLDNVDVALTMLNNMRSDYGSTQVQLESSVRNLQTAHTNLKAAESVVRDVDYAAESASFNKMNIIAQAGTYAMSQANAMQQNVMKLLQ